MYHLKVHLIRLENSLKTLNWLLLSLIHVSSQLLTKGQFDKKNAIGSTSVSNQE